MPTPNLQSFQNAVSDIQTHFEQHSQDSLAIQLGTDQPAVLFQTRWINNISQCNYTIPLMYQVTIDVWRNLCTWWLLQHPNSGRALPRQYDPATGVYKYNLIYFTTRQFNLHLGAV